MRVVGMSRSGNHAIVDWILDQAVGRSCFLNCAEPATNPFLTNRPLGADGIGHRTTLRGFDLRAEAVGRLSRKDLLLHSYEDTFLRAFSRPEVEERHDAELGSSARRFDILILRDPYNLFASRLAGGCGVVAPEVAMRIWCQHAREFLGQRRHLRHERVMISFDRWASSATYRRAIAAALGLRFDGRAALRVPGCAGGSSFDGLRFDGHADEMRVLSRWRAYAGNPDYLRLFTPTVVALSRRIFGNISALERTAGATQVAA
jgi:hypothetical protein